ncbi:hypothetical protein FGE12_25310 [Aggregicoccus sp. 17bor-14]|uniref:hypothetical protein n=1 Tax=Myxococcaceae TaxID=31 RepID=UPI00129C3793|nr:MULTISPECIES: hypothetical protein [Myxococcaceae]MBF5045751.1 hypothetical protein [Simulacricoccus sp. 17bor-14]MRI91486.1 hypothetical protein [Aggregicoccus sp. 17bor-14]
MRASLRPALLLPPLLLLAACAHREAAPAQAATAKAEPSALDTCAERYVKLVLAVGEHDANYVDAYYGPKAWAEEAKAAKVPLEVLGQRARELVQVLEAVPPPTEPLVAQRRRFLLGQVRSIEARVRLLQGEHLSFDAESEALYGARAPAHPESEFLRVHAELEQLLPGEGALPVRIERFRQGFVVPKDKLEQVFQAAIDEARRRTRAHLELPEGEAVRLELVQGKSWGGYNWYQGNAKSLVQVNTDLPIFASRVLDVAAHESYPGHHVYNVLLEQHLLRERGWVEFSVYPLYCPQSLIAEGSANYGIDVAFPDKEAYLRDVLFPLAGLDPSKAAAYVRVEALLSKLGYAENEAARGLLDGRMTRAEAQDYLVRYRLASPERAAKLLTSIESLRSYIINYNLGRDLVAAWVERQGGTAQAPERRWQVFGELLSAPLLPADLR